MTDPEAPPRALQELIRACRAGFEARFGGKAAAIASAPGRLNVIGEHTDYNDGLALPGAIDRWAVVALSRRDDGQVCVRSEALDEEVTAPLEAALSNDLEGWSRIPLGAGRVFAAEAGRCPGFDAYIGGNVPLGSGLSSSSAVEVGFLNALRHAFGGSLEDLELVHAAQRVEHQYLGVHSGLMDQYASQFARRGMLMLVDFRAVKHEYVDASLPGWVWVSLDSGVRHELVASGYGDRVAETRAALREIQRLDSSVSSCRDLERGHLDAIGSDVARRRLRHYVSENERVLRAATAIAAADTKALGELLLSSHTSLRDDYAVSCAELDFLVDAAVRSDACAGARMMGGGFGGRTINLVHADEVGRFVDDVGRGFENRFGYPPDAGTHALVGGARVHE